MMFLKFIFQCLKTLTLLINKIMIHISQLKTGFYFSFENGNKIYKVDRFTSNRKYLQYSDRYGNSYTLDLTQSFSVVREYRY